MSVWVYSFLPGYGEKYFTLPCTPKTPISQLIYDLSERTQRPLGALRLCFAGRELQEGRLKDYRHLVDGKTLHLFLRDIWAEDPPEPVTGKDPPERVSDQRSVPPALPVKSKETEVSYDCPVCPGDCQCRQAWTELLCAAGVEDADEYAEEIDVPFRLDDALTTLQDIDILEDQDLANVAAWLEGTRPMAAAPQETKPSKLRCPVCDHRIHERQSSVTVEEITMHKDCYRAIL